VRSQIAEGAAGDRAATSAGTGAKRIGIRAALLVGRILGALTKRRPAAGAAFPFLRVLRSESKL